MKLKNKKTGEAMSIYEILTSYDTLAELNEEWEDYEEPDGWCVTMYGGISRITKDDENLIPDLKEIGNYFNDKESAYDALDELKAWKRLKDKGFRFEGIKEDYTRILQSQDPFRTGKRYLQFNKSEDEEWMEENWRDLDLLFGGEE